MMSIIPIAIGLAIIAIFIYKKRREEKLEKNSLEIEREEIMKIFLSGPEDPRPVYTKEQVINFAEKLKKGLIKKYKLSSKTSYEELTSFIRKLPLDIELKAILIDFFIRVPKLKFAKESVVKKELEKLREDVYYIESNWKQLNISQQPPKVS